MAKAADKSLCEEYLGVTAWTGHSEEEVRERFPYGYCALADRPVKRTDCYNWEKCPVYEAYHFSLKQNTKRQKPQKKESLQKVARC